MSTLILYVNDLQSNVHTTTVITTDDTTAIYFKRKY